SLDLSHLRLTMSEGRPTADGRLFPRLWMLGAPAGPKVDTSRVLARFSHRKGSVRVGRVGVRRLVELASKQFGVVTRADLGCTEVSWKWLRGRLATGEWNRVHRGVFRLGCHQPGRDEREMAALLAAGQGAVLSHISAARRLGLEVPPRDESVHVTIPASRKAKVRGAKVGTSRNLSAGDGTHSTRLRVTQLARPRVGLASVVAAGRLPAAVDSAVPQHNGPVCWIARVLRRC